MELIAVSRNWERSSNEAGGKTKMSGSSYLVSGMRCLGAGSVICRREGASGRSELDTVVVPVLTELPQCRESIGGMSAVSLSR